MPIEFSTWQARMANTITDTSIVDKKSSMIQSLSPFQKRMLIADMLVPYTESEDLVHDWLVAFSVRLNTERNGQRGLIEERLTAILGVDRAKDYLATENDYEASRWLSEFRAEIIKGLVL